MKNNNNPGYRHSGIEKITAKNTPKNEPRAERKTAKRDLRVKGG